MSFGELRSYIHGQRDVEALVPILRTCELAIEALTYTISNGLAPHLVIDRWRYDAINGPTEARDPFVKDTLMYPLYADICIGGQFIHLFDVSHEDIWGWYRVKLEHYIAQWIGANVHLEKFEPLLEFIHTQVGQRQLDQDAFDALCKDIKEHAIACNLGVTHSVLFNTDSALDVLVGFHFQRHWALVNTLDRKSCRQDLIEDCIQHLLKTKTFNPMLCKEAYDG